MSVLAVVRPTSLVGQELRERLDARGDEWEEVRLLAGTDEEVGVLTETAGAPALVQKMEASSFEGVDLAFVCGSGAGGATNGFSLPPGVRSITLVTDPLTDAAGPVVAGVSSVPVDATDLASPHPAVVQLVHLVAALADLDLRDATATSIQPVSMATRGALDDLMGQARDVLSFQPVSEVGALAGQLVFNLRPLVGATDMPTRTTRAVTGREDVSLAVVEGGVFHGVASAVHLRFDGEPELDAVTAALLASPSIIRPEDDGVEGLGPIDAAGVEGILLGPVVDLGHGRFWLWSVVDNLGFASAGNALAVAAELLGWRQEPSTPTM